MIQETLDELKVAIDKSLESLKRELAKIRTGRANPDILDGVRVDYYGSPTPLKQVASISVPEARLLVLKVFDRSAMGAVEKAIMSSSLGLNPSNDGEVIRIPLPPLTEERRKDLTKVARAKGEDAKVAIRKARHDAKDLLEAMEKDGDAGADEVERGKKEMEEIVKGGSGKIDETVSAKEKAILEV
ncbi:MAG: ribosome recycling factor [Myxococcota bacterium]